MSANDKIHGVATHGGAGGNGDGTTGAGAPEIHDDITKATGLSAGAIRRPVFTLMMMLGLAVLGLVSFRHLAIDLFPDVAFPIAFVQTIYPGASPETMEREVSKRIEESLNTIQGVNRITSVSLESVSQVIVEFDL